MTSAEESVVNQVKAAIEHAGDRLKGFWVHFHFADGTGLIRMVDGSEVKTPETWNAIQVESAEVVPVREGSGGSPEVPSGDATGSEAPDPGPQEVDEAPMSKGKRKK